MRECGRTAKGKLEGLFQQETAEDHEVVPVAVLGLHDLGGLELGTRHVHDVWGFGLGDFWIC